MIRLLLLILPLLAEASPAGMFFPASAIIGGFTAMAAAVVFVFKMLMDSYERRIAEMSAAHDKRQADMSACQESRVHEMAESNRAIAEEVSAQWRATDRTNRLNAMRMISSQQVSSEFKEECRGIVSEVDSERDSYKHRLKE